MQHSGFLTIVPPAGCSVSQCWNMLEEEGRCSTRSTLHFSGSKSNLTLYEVGHILEGACLGAVAEDSQRLPRQRLHVKISSSQVGFKT